MASISELIYVTQLRSCVLSWTKINVKCAKFSENCSTNINDVKTKKNSGNESTTKFNKLPTIVIKDGTCHILLCCIAIYISPLTKNNQNELPKKHLDATGSNKTMKICDATLCFLFTVFILLRLI